MARPISVVAPSRLCLLGEHQDYLHLDVIAVAIDLGFFTRVWPRQDDQLRIAIRDRHLDRLGDDAPLAYENLTIDLGRPIVYQGPRDYLRSVASVLLRQGYSIPGLDVRMDSNLPIGKGMCSSSTMTLSLIKALLEASGHPDRDDPRRMAELGYMAEVVEFSEPGGRMDHYASALGGLVHLDFEQGFKAKRLRAGLSGTFLLFDSLEQKDTPHVLRSAKEPALEGLRSLQRHGIHVMADLIARPDASSLLLSLPPLQRRVLQAQLENHRLFCRGLDLLRQDPVDDAALGKLLSEHHRQLRDGLSLSTPRIESILRCALDNGAYGGKINGSGGGGCCFVYTKNDRAQTILQAVERLGYPGQALRQDRGLRREGP